MADRRVTHTRKDSDGTIAALCNPGEYWSPRMKRDAVSDINSRLHSYYVLVRGDRVGIHVDNGHLRTDPDKTTRNNLLELPDC
jgi:hypothetical protein